MSKLKIVEWFGGIGAATQAVKRLGIEYELVDYIELDKHAVKSFNLLNDSEFEPKDINNVNVNGYGEVDLLIAGGPCQDLSITGKQKGLINSDRSSLIGTIINKINEMEQKPKVILLENVKGLLGKKHTQDFEVIKDAFKELGYHGSHKLLNAKYFNVPQNRERVYCVLTRDKKFDGSGSDKFNTVNVNIKAILDKEAEWELADNFVEIGKYGYINATEKDLRLKSSYKRYGNINDNYLGTITATMPTKIYYKKENGQVLYRQLNAKECGRFMGFTDQDYDKVKEHITNNQLCKQAGNSIVVNVLTEILKRIGNKGEKMDNIKKVFKNIKLDDDLFYGEGRCAKTPDEKGDFVSRLSERSVAGNIMDYSKYTLLDNKEIKAGMDKKLIELSQDYEYEMDIEDVKVLKIVYGEEGEYIVDIEIDFEVIG